ncbi:hypothetical protein HED63_05260 [Ochrobactrum cytisi]|nr:hypothetical protein [Brucella cytisi]
MKQIDGQGKRTDTLAEGDHGKLTQTEAARSAGLSAHQQLQAIRVAQRFHSKPRIRGRCT